MLYHNHPGDVRDKHVLVLGGAGFLGSILVRKLLRMKYTVTVYDNFLYDTRTLDGIDGGDFLSVVRGDVRDYDRLREVLPGKDVIVHLAAIVGDAACDLDVEASKKINADSNRFVYEMAHEFGAGQYVYASTCSVYGFSNDLLDENSFLNPVSLYAQTKLTSELLLLKLRHKLNPTLTILRFATLYGWSSRPRFDLVVNTMTASALSRGKVEIYGGNQWRPHLHVQDAADSIVAVVEAPPEKTDGEIFNVGVNELNMTITELGEKIAGTVDGCTVERRVEKADPRNYLVDFSKFNKALGFEPRYNIIDGVKEIVRHYNEGHVTTFNDPVYSNVKSLKDQKSRVMPGVYAADYPADEKNLAEIY